MSWCYSKWIICLPASLNCDKKSLLQCRSHLNFLILCSDSFRTLPYIRYMVVQLNQQSVLSHYTALALTVYTRPASTFRIKGVCHVCPILSCVIWMLTSRDEEVSLLSCYPPGLESSASASWVLELQACTTITCRGIFFLSIIHLCLWW